MGKMMMNHWILRGTLFLGKLVSGAAVQFMIHYAHFVDYLWRPPCSDQEKMGPKKKKLEEPEGQEQSQEQQQKQQEQHHMITEIPFCYLVVS